MSLRGRGCLEIRRSDNPFFQPVNGDLGQSLHTMPTEWKTSSSSSTSIPNNTTFHQSASQSPTPRSNTNTNTTTTASVDGHFAFLYSRESDRIGARVPKPDRPELPRLPMRRTTQQQQQPSSSPLLLENDQQDSLHHHQPAAARRTAEEVLQLYRHETKAEDPRYLTSSNEYGKKAPNVATLVVDRACRPQGFSKSFNQVKPRNTSLTTALTKSTVHKAFDPQFA
eukprot:gene8896-9814_t